MAAVLLGASLGAAALAPPPAAAEPSRPPTGTAPAPVTAAPDERSALRAAKTGNRRVEVLGKRTETQQVFAEPSGHLLLEQYAVPQRVRKAGVWRPIDLTLVRDPDGTVSPVASTVDLRLSGGGTSLLIALADNGKRLGLSWPGRLPAPVLTGDTATYPEVLPGVDLVVKATVDGYRQHVVVKNRTGARNPALRTITFRTTLDGISLRATADGSINAVDGTGKPAFVSGTPLMWDTPALTSAQAKADPAVREAAQVARQRRVKLALRPGELSLTPVREVLDNPASGFPIVIDPDFGTGIAAWLHLNLKAPDQNGWGWDQGSGAKVGKAWNATPVYRSFFQFNINSIHGGIVMDAVFRITLNHSASCGPTPVELWHTNHIGNPTTWRGTGNGWWWSWMDARSGNANEGGGCGANQPDQGMEFRGDLPRIMQVYADSGWTLATVGLKAPNEGDQYQWKKFHPNTAVLQVRYNHRPSQPAGLNTVPPKGCGTASAPVALNTTTPTFAARLFDANLDNMAAKVEIREGSTVIHTVNSGTVASGSAITWPSPPEGVLPDNQPNRVFSYQAEAWDTNGHFSGWTAPCYFTVDRQLPGTPTVESADFPDGEPVKAVGQTGTLRLSPGSGPTGTPDTDVAGYRYGFQQDKLTGWAPADGSGKATIPMVLWQTARTLYVQSVDRAGNPSVHDTPCICTVWDLRATASPTTPARKPADVNGDGRGDVTALFDMGDNRTALWNVIARPDGGVHAPYVGWDSGIDGGFSGYRTRSVQGDFNGDGLADVAVFREDPDRRLRLFFLKSDSHRYDADPVPEWEGPVNSAQWTLKNLQLAVADANADGRADLIAFVPNTAVEYSFHVFAGAAAGLAAPVNWYTNPSGSAESARTKLVAGDFDGDGDGDAGIFYNYDGGLTKFWLHASNGTGAFATGALGWDSGPGNWDWNRGTPVVGNFNGDTAGVGGRGRDDIMMMYNYDGGHVKFWMYAGTATGITGTGVWWDSGPGAFSSGEARLSAGDFNADGKADIAALYESASATTKVHLFQTNSAGTAAVAPNLAAPAWSGPIGAKPANLTPETGRYYRLVASHSGKCVDVPGWSTANSVALQQYTCLEPGTNQRVTFVPVAGGPYHLVKFFHSGKCLDVSGVSYGDGPPMHQYDCHGGGNQQFRLEYLTGSGLDTQVRLRAAHSDKCLAIAGGSAGDTAGAVQWPCSGGPGTDHSYYVRLQP